MLLPIIILTVGGALVSALTVHEYGHALVAHRLGDETARLMGRLSLNPLHHLDPMGGLMLLVVGFGWGKPVPVNPALLQRGRQGMAAVSLAGPAFNLLLATLVAFLARATGVPLTLSLEAVVGDLTSPLAWASLLGGLAVFYNLLLGVFNLIPLAPLDGSKVVIGVAPREVAWRLSRLESYGPVILVLVIAADLVLRLHILSSLLMPPVAWLGRVLTGSPLV
ncbi:MAG: site-2 protease family protein [Chloroflexi bacterium]|nr:site-2 protease family protein [Chloroflexota bacterium]